MDNNENMRDKAVLVGIVGRGESEEELHKSLDELERLLHAYRTGLIKERR